MSFLMVGVFTMQLLNNAKIDDILEFTLKNEGAYSNHPNDRGGETYWGVTREYALAHGVDGKVTKKQAKKMYMEDAIKHGVFYLDPASALYVFDACVLFGFKRAVSWFQHAINLVAGRRVINDDGYIGQKTISAYESVDKKAVIDMLHKRILQHHVVTAQRNQKQRVFLRGWLNRAERRYKEFLENLNNG